MDYNTVQKSVTKNYIYNVAYQAVQMILPLVAIPYVSRVLGVEQIGKYSYVRTVATYFVLISQLGLNLYGRRQIAYVRDDRAKTTELFWKLVCLRAINFAIGLSGYCMVMTHAKENILYYAIFIIYILGDAADITWLFQAFEDFGIITLRNTVIRVLQMALIFAFVRSHDSLWIYTVIFSGSEFFSQLSMWLGLRKKVDFKPVSLRGCSKHIRGAVIMFLPQIITTIYTLVDKLILGLFSTETEVGLYSQSEQIIKVILAIITSMGTVVMPRISNDYALGKTESIKTRLTKNRNFIVFLAAPMIAGVYGIATNFVPWFFGPGFEAVSSLMVVISPIILLIALSDLYGMQYLIPTGHMKEYTIATAGGAIINVIMNLALVKRYAAMGVSAATVVSEFTVTFIMWIYARKYIRLGRCKIWRYVITGTCMGIIVKFIDMHSTGTMVWTFAEILVGIVIYGSILTLMRDEMITNIFQQVRLIKCPK